MRSAWARSWIVLRNLGILMMLIALTLWVFASREAYVLITGLSLWLIGFVLVSAAGLALWNEARATAPPKEETRVHSTGAAA
jgi:hypothetical protein